MQIIMRSQLSKFGSKLQILHFTKYFSKFQNCFFLIFFKKMTRESYCAKHSSTPISKNVKTGRRCRNDPERAGRLQQITANIIPD